jgi:hypothetical protein
MLKDTIADPNALPEVGWCRYAGLKLMADSRDDLVNNVVGIGAIYAKVSLVGCGTVP